MQRRGNEIAINLGGDEHGVVEIYNTRSVIKQSTAWTVCGAPLPAVAACSLPFSQVTLHTPR